MNKRLVLEDGLSECIFDTEKVRLPASVNKWDCKNGKNTMIVEIGFSDGFKYRRQWSHKDVKALIKKHHLNKATDSEIESYLIIDTSELGTYQHYRIFGITPTWKMEDDRKVKIKKEDEYDI